MMLTPPPSRLSFAVALILAPLLGCQDPWRTTAVITPQTPCTCPEPTVPEPSPNQAASEDQTPATNTETALNASPSSPEANPPPAHVSADSPTESPTDDTLLVDLPEVAVDPEPTDRPTQQPTSVPQEDQPKTAQTSPKPKALKSAVQHPTPPPSPPPPSGACVHLNTSPISELMTLPGVGQSRAQHIISSRPFSRPRDLTRVKGIGPKTFDRILPQLCPLP